jgi:hypothetical protein
MQSTGIEFFNEVFEYHTDSNDIKAKYARLRSLLERVCKDLTSTDSVQFSNLFSRLSFVCTKTGLDKRKTYQINTFRINANNVLHSNFSPTRQDYLQDLKALCNAISHFYETEIPGEIFEELPTTEIFKPSVRPKGQRIERIRVDVERWDDSFIYGFDEDHPTDEPIKIKHHIEGVNVEFNLTVNNLWKGAQMNLIDVVVEDSGLYSPEYLVLEPDYLMDISSLAECFKEYGSHPLNFLQSKFEALKNTKHILLGSAANHFLDAFINEKPANPVVYNEAIKKVFKSSPFEFSTCSDFTNELAFREFIQETKSQYENVRNVVNNVFVHIDHSIDREEAVLEPSFICEHFGLQGRLDLLQKKPTGNFSKIIELKSGKAPFPDNNTTLIGKNHTAQTFLYSLTIQSVLGIPFSNLRTYIFYSKYNTGNMRLSVANKSRLRSIINTRNLIVAAERSIATDGSGTVAKTHVDNIRPETLITNDNVNQTFLDNYIIPQIRAFKSHFNGASTLELSYFYALYSFVTKEHFLSKAGDVDYEGSKGISTLWLSTPDEKIEAGEILNDLTIVFNNTEEEPSTLELQIPAYDEDFMPNFRKGDIIILYEKNAISDNVTNKQIFKGAIEKITQSTITLRLRCRQRNKSVLPESSKYAIEHDFLDSSYNAMYRSLYCFLHANKNRRDLLLYQRQPIQDQSKGLSGNYGNSEINDIILKAKQAQDYFILVGPPGTGKTSQALKSMIEEFHSDPLMNILLLSYTNRAVDEICEALDRVDGRPPYIRIGNELSCEERHRGKLLEKIIQNCDTRDEVKSTIQRHRIYVGTVASISSKTELFKLKTFDVAIIDEASQILEPQILGVLSAKDSDGNNAIAKFILVGDYKQLPAVVLQSTKDSLVETADLNSIGLTDRRNSLFERLYRTNKRMGNTKVIGMLSKQGRMHPEVSLFPNYAFYNSQLTLVPTPHQTQELEFIKYDRNNGIESLLATKRLSFISSEKSQSDKSNKINSNEAKIVASIVKSVYHLYRNNNLKFDPEQSIGVITPYRSQIALIKREIHKLSNPDLDKITVDTVERFQGSQRDIIVYSFSVNQFFQLDFLSSNIEEDGVLIDRKLNVAITRAKKQLLITGNPAILANNLIYFRLIEFIRSKGGFINCTASEFSKGNFKIEEPSTSEALDGSTYEPDSSFSATYNALVIQPIKGHPRTVYPDLIYGNNSDFNRLNVIEFGRANFSSQENLFGYTQAERINLYCYYNMRKHYFSSFAIFKNFKDFFSFSFLNTDNRISFFDFGCGPATSAVAFNQYFKLDSSFSFNYIGIDTSVAMLEKAQEFLTSGLFSRDTKYVLKPSINKISDDYVESIFMLSNTVIFNFSYLFGNLNKDGAERLSTSINSMMDKYPLNKYILIFQNSALEKRNRSYATFKKLVSRLKSISSDMPKTETITYRNAQMSHYDKNESVFYEILSN